MADALNVALQAAHEGIMGQIAMEIDDDRPYWQQERDPDSAIYLNWEPGGKPLYRETVTQLEDVEGLMHQVAYDQHVAGNAEQSERLIKEWGDSLNQGVEDEGILATFAQWQNNWLFPSHAHARLYENRIIDYRWGKKMEQRDREVRRIMREGVARLK
jgi:hypothetical protein